MTSFSWLFGFLAKIATPQTRPKWTGEKAREIEDTGFKLYYSGKDNRRKNGVGIIIAKGLMENVVAVTRK